LQVDEAPVWSELGHAYLAHGQVPDAISAYLRSNDSSKYLDVIAACTAAGCYEELVKYLLMVRAVALEGSCCLYCSVVLLCALDKQA